MSEQEMSSKFKELIDDFLSAVKSSKNKDSIENALVDWMNTVEEPILFDTLKALEAKEYEKFYAPVKYLLSQKVISSKYSELHIRDEIICLYYERLCEKNNVDVAGLIKELLKSKKIKYKMFSEIENIHIFDDEEYKLIDSTIKILKEQDINLNKENLKDQQTGNYKLLDKPSIYTEIQAGDHSKAKEIAVDNFTVSFNLLRLYFPDCKPVLKGYFLSGTEELIGYDEPKRSQYWSYSSVNKYASPAKLGKDIYNNLVGLGIKELENDTAITGVVKNCLYWYGLGLDGKHPSARLVNFVTILESSLKKGDEKTELTKAVSERGALILYDKYDERKEAVKDLREIYKHRSTVVHTGALIDEKDYAYLAGDYAREVLMKLIKMSKKLNGDFKVFIEYIDDIKLGRFKNG